MSGTLIIGKLRGPEMAALVEDRVTDWVFGPTQKPVPETVFKAKVDRLLPGSDAAFVALGDGQQGYLRDAKGLASGEFLLVEATSIPEPGKAVPVSRRVLYRQRYTIHTPGAPGINVARGIDPSEERARLIRIVDDHVASMEDWVSRMADICDPDDVARVRRVLSALRDGGTILRTAAKGQPSERITRDLDLAVAARLSAEDELADPEMPPGLVAMAPLPREYGLREWGDRADRIVVGPGDFDTLTQIEAHRLSPFVERIESMRDDPFDHYGVWDEIERLKSSRVDLPSGAWMAVEATRAMVTIDVNTAGEFGGGAALTANLEAARELPRQLRLRGLGGQIIIDFAPLPKKDRRRIEDALKNSFRRDPIETTLAGWTPLGHFELLRKRERRPLTELLAD